MGAVGIIIPISQVNKLSHKITCRRMHLVKGEAVMGNPVI